MGVGVQQAGAGRAGEEEAGQKLAGPVALLLGAVRDDLGQRDAVDPLGHQHLLALVHHRRDDHVRVVRELLRVGALRLGLQPVVQLLRDAVPQLRDQRLDVHARDERTQQPGEPAQLAEVGEQGLTRARVLHLDRHLTAVVPHRPVHLADRGSGGRLVLELLEEVAPVRPEPLLEHAVHGAGGHRRGGLLELGQGRAVGAGDLLRQRRLEDGQCLPELHRAALELAEHLEELLRRALLQLAADDLRGLAHDPLAQPPGRPAGEAERERGELGGTGDRLPGKIRHAPSRSQSAVPRLLRVAASSTAVAPPLSRAFRHRLRSAPVSLSRPPRRRIPDAAGPAGRASPDRAGTPPSEYQRRTVTPRRGRPGRAPRRDRPPPWPGSHRRPRPGGPCRTATG